jgi:hypothetical protein
VVEFDALKTEGVVKGLRVYEALFLLAIDIEGDFIASVKDTLESSLAAGVLAELVLLHKINIYDNQVSVNDSLSIEDPFLDNILFAIADMARMRKIKYWINTLIYRKIVDETGHRLVEKNILTRKKKHLKLVTPYNQQFGMYPTAKYYVIDHLREIVLAGYPYDPEDWVLLQLLYRGNMLSLVFARGERKAARLKIKKLNLDKGENQENNFGKMIDDILAEIGR